MGAWGSKVFENDEASDWLDAFESDGSAAVETALAAVLDLDANDYVQATEAAAALAAAEVVAAAKDGDVKRLPEEAHGALLEHREALNEADFGKRAQRAVQRVRRHSELKDEWDESGDAEVWSDELLELLERLKG